MILSSLLNLQSVRWLSDYELWRCIQTHRSPDMIKLASSLPAIEIPPHPPSLRSTPSPPQRLVHHNTVISIILHPPATPPHHPPLTLFFFIHFHDMFWVNSSQTTSVSPIREGSVMGSCEAPVWSCWCGEGR